MQVKHLDYTHYISRNKERQWESCHVQCTQWPWRSSKWWDWDAKTSRPQDKFTKHKYAGNHRRFQDTTHPRI